MENKYFCLSINVNNLSLEEKHSLVQKVKMLNNDFYFRYLKINNCNILKLCGIHSINLAKNILFKLRKIINSEIEIEQDEVMKLFANEKYYMVYKKWEIIFDNILFNYYFQDTLGIGDIVYFLEETYNQLPKVNFYISHISHYWGFIHSLNIEKRRIFCEFIEKESIKYDNCNQFKGKIEILDLIDDIDILVREENLDFFVPYRLTDLLKNNNASYLHRQTWKNEMHSPVLTYDKYLIANKWLLNILYKKFPLLNITILNKFTINYMLGLKDSSVDFKGAIYKFYTEGLEELF